MSQLYCGVLFVFLSWLFRLRSFWNPNKTVACYVDKQGTKRVGDIWTYQKSTSDYLHHLKFEFMQFVFFG